MLLVTFWGRKYSGDWLAGYNPDLIPTEIQWYNLKKKIAEKQISSTMELVQVIKNLWCTEISQAFTHSLIYMANCIAKKSKLKLMIIKVKGDAIKY